MHLLRVSSTRQPHRNSRREPLDSSEHTRKQAFRFENLQFPRMLCKLLRKCPNKSALRRFDLHSRPSTRRKRLSLKIFRMHHIPLKYLSIYHVRHPSHSSAAGTLSTHKCSCSRRLYNVPSYCPPKKDPRKKSRIFFVRNFIIQNFT